jgi:hypothetical protein
MEEALEACKPNLSNSTNTQIYATFMLIDMWRHFPQKFNDDLAENKVLEEIKNSLKRTDRTSDVLMITIFTNLIELYEDILTQKATDFSANAARKIHNLITHVLYDLDAGRVTIKEYFLDHSLNLLQKGYLDLNEVIKVFLKVLEHHANSFGVIDIKVMNYFMTRLEELNDRNILYLLDFNCHLFMADIGSMAMSKENIVCLVNFIQKNESSVSHFIKFIRLVFNWIYKSKLNKDRSNHPEVNQAREGVVMDLLKRIIRNETMHPRIKVVLKNMAALINYQLKRYCLPIKEAKKTLFMPGFKEIIISEEDEVGKPPEGSIEEGSSRKHRSKKSNLEEIVNRYDHIFDMHLNDPQGKEMDVQLDKLIISVDLSKKTFEPLTVEGTNQPTTQELNSLSNIPVLPPIETERSRHLKKLEEFKRVDERFKKIKEGAYADKKTLALICSLIEKRKQQEHERVQQEAMKSMEEQEKHDKYVKQVEEIKILTGTRKDDAPNLTLEQLCRPMGSEIVDITSSFNQQMLYSPEDEEHSAVVMPLLVRSKFGLPKTIFS